MNNIRKFIVAAIAAAGTAVSLGVLPEEYNKYVAVAVAFLGALGVYVAPNTAPDG